MAPSNRAHQPDNAGADDRDHRAQRARGICGSGLIDVVAELFLTGIINEKGKFNVDLGHPRIRVAGGMAEYVLVAAADSAIGADIAITEADLDNLIRTKGAIYAGIATLLEQMEMTVDAIEQVYIGGGFGRYLELQRRSRSGCCRRSPRRR